MRPATNLIRARSKIKTNDVLPSGLRKARVLVVGSSNTDLVVFCERLPKPGETVLGGKFKTFGGGKGANQAVAAARAGGEVTFLGAYGADRFGDVARERLEKEGICVDFFKRVSDAPSGVALILVDGVTRDNMIAVAKSANESVGSAMISAARSAFETTDVVISQLEVRDEAVEAVAESCSDAGKLSAVRFEQHHSKRRGRVHKTACRTGKK